jgi:hypothetical protein
MRSWPTGVPLSPHRHYGTGVASRIPHRALGRLHRRAAPHNGLLLSALWDAAFDRGLVSFADDGTVLTNPQLSETARNALGLANAPPLVGLRDAHRANLALHRARNGF